MKNGLERLAKERKKGGRKKGGNISKKP